MNGRKAKQLRKLAEAMAQEGAPKVEYHIINERTKIDWRTSKLSSVSEEDLKEFKIDDGYIEVLKKSQLTNNPNVRLPIRVRAYTILLVDGTVRKIYKTIKAKVKGKDVVLNLKYA